jgi:hypothetical protein
MKNSDWILWSLLAVSVIVATAAWMSEPVRPKEGFTDAPGSIAGISMADLTTRALDAAPSTSEVKQHYKTLLVFADSDIRQQGTKGLRILADFRDRVYGPRDFRAELKTEDFLANWPDWLPPLDTTIQEPAPAAEDAVTAESRMLAYLQRYFPQEDTVDQQTGSTIRNMIEDFGRRFVFEDGETVQLRSDFLAQPLLQNWRNPAASR